MKLLQATLANLAPPRGQSEAMIFDDDVPGLGLRIRASGLRTWIFQYRFGERGVRRISLGDAGVISLAKARKTAADLHAKVRLGADPAGEKVEAQARAGDTMAAALAVYMPYQEGRLKPLSLTQVRRHLFKHCKSLHALQLARIDRKTVSVRMTAIAGKSGPVESNRVRSSLAAFFEWCIREGWAEHNPAAGGSKSSEKSRERVLEDAELKAIWKATADGRDYSAIVRLLMLSGCRVAEIGGLRWEEVSADAIELPGTRTKNKRPHTLPHTAPVRAILDDRERNGEFVFGRVSTRPFTGWSVCKAELDERLGDAVKPWTHHDLRRTAATRLADMGISSDAIEAVLNHVSGFRRGVHGIYNRSDYSEQKRHALNAWADHLLGIVEGGAKPAKVVALRA